LSEADTVNSSCSSNQSTEGMNVQEKQQRREQQQQEVTGDVLLFMTRTGEPPEADTVYSSCSSSQSTVAINNQGREVQHQHQILGANTDELSCIGRAGESSSQADSITASCNSSQSTGTQEASVGPPQSYLETSVDGRIDPIGVQKGAPMRRLGPKPWATGGAMVSQSKESQGDDDVDEEMAGDPILRYPTYMEKSILTDPADNSRGYRRYRINGGGKNKTRPWRDETDRFDAY
jgi:hypothetical protein